jgi:uncharacterized protein with ParB-like and HNH nuclease domain
MMQAFAPFPFVLLEDRARYLVPMYQRNYAW